jgi:hypothetical protein
VALNTIKQTTIKTHIVIIESPKRIDTMLIFSSKKRILYRLFSHAKNMLNQKLQVSEKNMKKASTLL